MKSSCMGTRSQSGVTGLPPRVAPVRAAWMLVVNRSAREGAVEEEGSGLLGEVAEIPGTEEEGDDADGSPEEDADGKGGDEALSVVGVGADGPGEDEAGEDADAGGKEEIGEGENDAVVERGAGVKEGVDGGAVEARGGSCFTRAS